MQTNLSSLCKHLHGWYSINNITNQSKVFKVYCIFIQSRMKIRRYYFFQCTGINLFISGSEDSCINPLKYIHLRIVKFIKIRTGSKLKDFAQENAGLLFVDLYASLSVFKLNLVTLPQINIISTNVQEDKFTGL